MESLTEVEDMKVFIAQEKIEHMAENNEDFRQWCYDAILQKIELLFLEQMLTSPKLVRPALVIAKLIEGEKSKSFAIDFEWMLLMSRDSLKQEVQECSEFLIKKLQSEKSVLGYAYITPRGSDEKGNRTAASFCETYGLYSYILQTLTRESADEFTIDRSFDATSTFEKEFFPIKDLLELSKVRRNYPALN